MAVLIPVATMLQVIGTLFLLRTFYKWLDAASLWLLPPLSLSRYQRPQQRSWALITGASAGIGLGCAQELAARGFNVVILGHKPDELGEAKAAIEAESPSVSVKVLVLDAITASAPEIQQALATIASLPLTVLVNNVGGFPIAQPALRLLAEYNPAEVDRLVNLNARFMAHVCRALLPVLARNEPSLMLNISSAAKLGMPNVALYSACKGFIVSLSKAMQREMSAAGAKIDMLAIIPGDVKTQAQTEALTPGTPDARRYAKEVMDRAVRAVDKGYLEVMPWFLHAVQIGVLDSVPEWAFRKFVLSAFETKKKAAAERHRASTGQKKEE